MCTVGELVRLSGLTVTKWTDVCGEIGRLSGLTVTDVCGNRKYIINFIS